MPKTLKLNITALALGLLAALPARAADEIAIGASLPLSGPLSGFGMYTRWGYEAAIADLNKAGGLVVNGRKLPVRLVVRDDKTDPNVTASNTETLIARDGVVAMLGSCTPALANAGALAAERRKVPLVTGCNPLMSFKAVRKWQYAWNLFFSEDDLAAASFRMLADYHVATNRKIAILTENAPDGQTIGGTAWPANAHAGGYDVVMKETYPIDSLQFGTMINRAKLDDADIALVMAIPPQAIAIRKQMASASYFPKMLVMEKGAEPEMFQRALGNLAEGVLVGGYWDPSLPYPGAKDLAQRFEAETHQTQSQHIADSYAAAQVLLDAIAAAGSTDREKINAAIGRTDKTYVVGPVKFDGEHTSRIPMMMMQWQKGKAVVVWPKDRATGQLQFPLPR